VAFLFSAGAMADSTSGKSMSTRACVTAYESARAQEASGGLRAALAAFEECDQAICGGLLQQTCSAGRVRLEADLPTIVPKATDDSGKPLVGVSVRMDGQLLISRLDGAVAVDPGVRELTFEVDDRVAVTEKLVIVQGQHDRVVPVVLPPSAHKTANARAKAAPELSSAPNERDTQGPLQVGATSAVHSRSTSALPYLLSAVGVAGLGGYGVVTYLGRRENSRMVAECPPTCSQARVTHIRTIYFAADVSLGLGIAAIGTATWLFLRRDSVKKPASMEVGYTVGIQPVSAGAVATVAGAL
jgi:hypothetical protein